MIRRILHFMQEKGIRSNERWERDLTDVPGAVRALGTSPDRREIEADRFLEQQGLPFHVTYFTRIFPKAMRSVRGIKKGLQGLSRNPVQPETEASERTIQDIREAALACGADVAGFCRIDPEYIFHGKSVLYRNTIVLGKKMDREIMSDAPSPESFEMIMRTYAELGDAANHLATVIRKYGFGAQSSHSLGGLAVYPALGQKAGLGYVGSNGLLITPEFGPCLRLAAVFTCISNLPDPGDNPYGWVMDYCRICNICIRICPGGAIRSAPVRKSNGTLSFIETEKCLPDFYHQYGCSWCIRECPFTYVSWDVLRNDLLTQGNAFYPGKPVSR